MAAYTLYEASVVVCKDVLASLSAILDKVEASPMANTMADARIHPEMLPFNFQIYNITTLSEKMVARLSGAELKEYSLDNCKTMADFRARIAEAQAELDAADKATINAREREDVPIGLGKGTPDQHIESWAYVHGWAIPNIYFHLTTVYDIARKEGLELGKRDYLMPFLQRHIKP